MSVGSSLRIELQLQIDACCQRFEAAWRAGKSPVLEEYILELKPVCRDAALIELVEIEKNYRRKPEGDLYSPEELRDLHPELASYIAAHFGGDSSKVDVTQIHVPGPNVPSASDSLEFTRTFQPSRGSSRGLHIRCPHCSNPVELVSDISFDNITCRTCGSTFSLVDNEEDTRLAPTLQNIGRFEILSRLGVGGFGTVWKARDPELERAVAIKIPRKGQLSSREIENFWKEAKTTAQLNHPNIVPVYEIGKDGDSIFIVTEFIRGVTLSDWLTGAQPSFLRIGEILREVALALEHAHQHGVIHRDLKPSNVLVDLDEKPLVMDFGLAKREGLEIAMTMEGQILGTPAYMSPEQAGGNTRWTDKRMDIYSFGVVLFRLITGELPFRGNAQMQIQTRLTHDAPDPRTLNRYIPRDLATICIKCMERDPNGRYSTAQEVADELQRFVRNEPILARPISKLERVLRWSKRKPALATAAALTCFLAIAGPTAAVIIEQQRVRQAELLVEKNNLIERMGDERSSLTNEVADLLRQLSVWKGQANPWEIWPPSAVETPQQMLLQEIAKTGAPPSAASDETIAATAEDSAFRCLAQAAVFDTLDLPAQAVDWYQRAAPQLQNVSSQQPASLPAALALADCYVQLARLHLESDRQQAEDWLRQARDILRNLPVGAYPMANAQLMDTEMNLAVVPGFDRAADSLQSAQSIRAGFSRQLPQDARQFYELVCSLTRRTPFLSLSYPAAVPEPISKRVE